MARQASSQIAGTAPHQAEYPSALFSKFCGYVNAMRGKVPLLDLGPSTTGNVMYWVRLGFEPIEGRGVARPVLTREVETLFQPFRETRIMVIRHGSREALGRRA